MEKLEQVELSRKPAMFRVFENTDAYKVLSQISIRKPWKLKGLQFGELFLWLSDSFGIVSASNVGDEANSSPVLLCQAAGVQQHLDVLGHTPRSLHRN